MGTFLAATYSFITLPNANSHKQLLPKKLCSLLFSPGKGRFAFTGWITDFALILASFLPPCSVFDCSTSGGKEGHSAVERKEEEKWEGTFPQLFPLHLSIRL